MKRALGMLFWIVVVAGSCFAQVSANRDQTAAVATVVDDWHDAASKADFKRYFDHFAPGAIFMGTDATERWTVEEFRAYAKPHFDKGKAWSFKAHDRHIMFADGGKAAWFDEQLDTPNLGPSRGSGVLTLIGTEWKIAHYNLTIPIPNDLCEDFVKRIAAYHASAKPAAAKPEAPLGDVALHLLTFNIRYHNPDDGKDAWPNRREMVSELIRSGKYDLVGLQEALVGQLNDLRTDLPEFASVGVGRDDGKDKGEYAAILYRRDRFQVVESGTFWLSDTPDVPGSKSWGNGVTRVCTWARFAEKEQGPANRKQAVSGTAAPASFYVYNVHLDHQSQTSRDKSVRLVLRRLAERKTTDPVVWTGDFNAGEASDAIRFVKGDTAGPKHEAGLRTAEELTSLPVLADSFRLLYPDQKPAGTFNRFKGTSDGEKIDYIFVPTSTKIVESAIHRTNKDGRYPSDHFPVSARVVLSMMERK